MKVKHTIRGFEIIANQGYPPVQQSSTKRIRSLLRSRPGLSFLWFGEERLNREQVSNYLKTNLVPQPLIEHLKAWLKTGSLIVQQPLIERFKAKMESIDRERAAQGDDMRVARLEGQVSILKWVIEELEKE